MIDLHSHHYRCGHAEGALLDYVRRAAEMGLSTLGLSDHSPLFAEAADEAAPGMHMPKSSFAGYVQEAHALKRRFAGRVEVLVGVEADFLPGTEATYREALEAQPLDYVLGAVHYFGGFHVYDPRRWQQNPDTNAVFRDYFGLVQRAARSGLFDVLAHIDAVKGLGRRPSEALEETVDETVAVIRESGVAVEINTSGLRKTGESFPGPAIVKKLHEAGVPLTFGSDAHRISELGYGWAEVRRELERQGVRELAVFRERRRTLVPLASLAPAPDPR